LIFDQSKEDESSDVDVLKLMYGEHGVPGFKMALSWAKPVLWLAELDNLQHK
jgi:hypothetical protein